MTRNPLRILSFATSLLLVACAVGPDYSRPAVPGNKAYPAPGSTPTSATDVPGGESQRFDPGIQIAADWYQLFESPKLNALISDALNDNPTLEGAQARLRKARYQLATFDSALYPHVDANLGVGREKTNGSTLGLSSITNTFNLYSVGLSVNYDIDIAGMDRRAVESGQARVAAEQYALIGTYLTLIDNLVVTALRVATTQDEISATESIIANDQQELDVVRAQERAGTVTRVDVLRATSQLAAEQATLPRLRQELTAYQTQLAILSGTDPGTFQVPHLTMADFKLPVVLPYSVPSDLVRQRPDILQSESQLHAANAAVGVATANLYPHIMLTAGYGGLSNDSGSLTSATARTWELGGALLAPIFHGGELRAERDAAVEDYKTSFAQYRSTVLSAFGQVTDTLSAIRNDADTLQAEYSALTSADASRNLVQLQYRRGAVQYLDVLTDERSYFRADLAYIDALGQRYIDTAGLYQALGGGWWNATSSTQGAAPGAAD